MAYSLYLIRNTRDTDLYYAEHGEIGGVPDAVGYDEPLHAMKFRTYEEAQAYIDTSSRSGQETAIVRRSLPPRSFYLARLWNYGYAPQRQADPGPPAGADARPASSLEMLKEEKQMSEIKPVVSILMGSRSDLPTMENCFNQLKEFGIPFEAHALSAHRTPNEVIKLAEGAKDRGIKVIIAAAGGAAHLGGVIASSTTLPVIGVPIQQCTG